MQHCIMHVNVRKVLESSPHSEPAFRKEGSGEGEGVDAGGGGGGGRTEERKGGKLLFCFRRYAHTLFSFVSFGSVYFRQGEMGKESARESEKCMARESARESISCSLARSLSPSPP